MAHKGKLELTWVGKDERPRLEPRVLVEEPARSYGDSGAENMLIFGDNLLALKALEQDFAGKIKCICIDPPYNTGAAFTHFDDGLEHSLWLTLIRNRLETLRTLLRSDGAIFVHIDDTEGHYLKVLMDEVFGRQCFVATFVWQKVDSPNDNKVAITPDHEFILCYTKVAGAAAFKQKNDASVLDAFRNRDESGRLYRDRLLKKNGKNSLRQDRPSMYFPVKAPDGKDVYPIHDDGREARWALGKTAVSRLVSEGQLIWKNRGTESESRWVPYTREYAPNSPVRPHFTIWTDVLTSRQAKAHQKLFLPLGTEPFDTPKTEQLMERMMEMSSNPGDWVLDSFGGSGTTGAVAHKMGRRWIMVELGEHCHTHIIPRMQKVVDGTDQGGISETADWKGGGGFKYYRLAESLLVRDKDLSTKDHPVYVINPRYDGKMLIRAICKIENFRYRNEGRLHGVSSENRFLHVTTSLLTQGYLDSLAEDIGPDQSLLVYCTRRARDLRLPESVEIKRIPRDLLEKCDFEEGK